jgi:hypothetical protein
MHHVQVVKVGLVRRIIDGGDGYGSSDRLARRLIGSVAALVRATNHGHDIQAASELPPAPTPIGVPPATTRNRLPPATTGQGPAWPSFGGPAA